MGVLDRLRKRRKYPVEIAGEEVFIRAMSQDEFSRSMALQGEEESYGMAIGFGLLDEGGESPLFVQQEGEGDKEFGRRVLDETGFPTDTRAELSEKILKLSLPPTAAQRDKLKKS
jgi:hypothetical protein